MPLHERAAQQQDVLRQRNAAMREELAKQKMAEVTSKPKINAKSRRLAGASGATRAARSAEWEERRQAKLEAERERQRISEELECRKPRLLSRQSAKIMESRAERTASSAAFGAPKQDVSERLIAEGVANEERRRRRQREAEAAAKRMHQPKISVHSANLHREGSVSARLYERAQVEAYHHKVQRWERDHKENHDMKTGQVRFTPQINSKSRKLVAKSQARRARRQQGGVAAAAAVPVEDRLLQRGAEYTKRRAARERKVERKVREERQQCKISDHSNALASRQQAQHGNGRGKPESMLDRLSKPIGAVRSSTLETMDQYTFAPRVNAATKRIT